MKDKKLNKKVKLAVGLALLVIFIVLLILIASYYKDYGKSPLSTNNNAVFNIDDLKLDSLKYGSTEDEVKAELGKPSKEKIEKRDIYNYKVLTYSGATLTLKENYNDFILCKVEVTSSKYILSRGVKVGKKITYVFNHFYVENPLSAYMYGNYTNKALNDKEVKDNIRYGVRSSENVLYVNRDKVVDDLPVYIAKLDILYANGVIYKITWSYDVN